MCHPLVHLMLIGREQGVIGAQAHTGDSPPAMAAAQAAMHSFIQGTHQALGAQASIAKPHVMMHAPGP